MGVVPTGSNGIAAPARETVSRRVAAPRRRGRRLRGTVGGLGLAVAALAARPCLVVVVVVERRRCRVHVIRHGRPIARYAASVGMPTHPTPIGLFRVSELVRDPAWVVPDSDWAGELAGTVLPADAPGNLLRARWIRFCGPYGIHGTDDEAALGRPASHGCVRVGVAAVEDLFERVTLGTPVVVLP